jgi:hypothetical protein
MHKTPTHMPRRLPARILSVLLAWAVSACANGSSTAQSSAPPNTHACLPTETVGFSCVLNDGRLLSLCASPGFNEYTGNAVDNPGYAYVAISAGKSPSSFTYPPNPREYKKHMHTWVSLSAAPHLFVSSPKGEFLHFSLDIDTPADARTQYVPEGWPLPESTEPFLCTGQINRDGLDPFMAQMVSKDEWKKNSIQSAPR